jgi:hypothetical protein
MNGIQTNSRVSAEGYDVVGEVIEILVRDDGRIAKVRHDDGLENWYRVESLALAPGAGTVRFVRPRHQPTDT